MTRRLRCARPLTSLVAIAACAAACQTSKSGAGAENPPAPAGTPTSASTTTTAEADELEAAAEKAPAEPTRSVASGLDLGMSFAAFEITNVDSEERYCQVCRFGSAPKVMLVGTLEDAEFHEDLADVEAVLARHRRFGAAREDDPVKVFAVVTREDTKGLGVPTREREALIADAAALRRRLGLHMPVVVPNVEDDPAVPGGVFEGHYRITKSRTIMVANEKNVVTYSEVAPVDLATFDAVIGPLMSK